MLRLEQAMNLERTGSSNFAMEVVLNREGAVLIPRVSVACLGNADSDRFVMKGILTERLAQPLHGHVVRQVVRSHVQSSLDAGELRTVTLPALDIHREGSLRLVIVIADEGELNAFQCLGIDLE
jgi:hypothetical protein